MVRIEISGSFGQLDAPAIVSRVEGRVSRLAQPLEGFAVIALRPLRLSNFQGECDIVVIIISRTGDLRHDASRYHNAGRGGCVPPTGLSGVNGGDKSCLRPALG